MQRDPTTGVAGAKPRLPRLKTAKEEISKLSREYLAIRNRQMRAKALMAEMEGAARRGQLLERKLVECQASYLLIAMRQRILRLAGGVRPATGRPDGRSRDQDGARRRRAGSARRDQRPSEQGGEPPLDRIVADENGEKPGPPSQGKPPQAKGNQEASFSTGGARTAKAGCHKLKSWGSSQSWTMSSGLADSSSGKSKSRIEIMGKA